MAESKVQINDQAFHRRGVELSFDEARFGELIDEFAPGAQAPEVVITPHMLWDRGSALQRLRNLASGDTVLPVGGYSQKTNTITVPAGVDPDRTNKLLLHETKHFIDAETGESKDSPKIAKRRIAGGLAIAGAGMAVGLLTGKRNLTAVSAGVALATLPATYWHSPHEIAAREFATAEEVKDKFGKIVTYKSR